MTYQNNEVVAEGVNSRRAVDHSLDLPAKLDCANQIVSSSFGADYYTLEKLEFMLTLLAKSQASKAWEIIMSSGQE